MKIQNVLILLVHKKAVNKFYVRIALIKKVDNV